ncbi:MAG: phosphodiester glycosidase family protein [Verrucomicrobiota bacterium]
MHEQSAVPEIEHWNFELREAGKDEQATFEIAFFSAKSANLKVIDNASGSDSLAQAAARENSVAGVNGGYFDPNFKPLGLRVNASVITTPLTHSRLLTGIFCASSRGFQILRLAEPLPKKCVAAIECGPFLVDHGAAVKGLDDRRLARRTFTAVTRPEGAALGVCTSAISLAELAQALTALDLGRSKVWRALNLDGGSSSAFWFRRNDGTTVSISEVKSVRDFVGVSGK